MLHAQIIECTNFCFIPSFFYFIFLLSCFDSFHWFGVVLFSFLHFTLSFSDMIDLNCSNKRKQKNRVLFSFSQHILRSNYIVDTYMNNYCSIYIGTYVQFGLLAKASGPSHGNEEVA